MVVSGKFGRWCGWLAALAAGLFTAASVHAGGHGEKIQFSEPATPVAVSNLTASVAPPPSRLNPEPSRFRQVQEDLFRPLTDAIAIDNPIDFGDLPPPQRYQPSRPMSHHSRMLFEQQKNWAFTDLNDLYPETTLEQALGIKSDDLWDTSDKNAPSLIERYYQRQGEQNAMSGMQKPYQTGYGDQQGLAGQQDLTTGSALTAVSQQFSEGDSFFNKNVFSAMNSDSSSKSFGSAGDMEQARKLVEEEQAEQKRRDEFNHLLDPSLPATKPSDDLFASPSAHDALFNPSSALATQPAPAAPQPYHSVLYPLGITDPTANALHSSVFDDPTAQALGLPNPVHQQPAPPPVTVQSIQSILDPYNANRMKRNF